MEWRCALGGEGRRGGRAPVSPLATESCEAESSSSLDALAATATRRCGRRTPLVLADLAIALLPGALLRAGAGFLRAAGGSHPSFSLSLASLKTRSWSVVAGMIVGRGACAGRREGNETAAVRSRSKGRGAMLIFGEGQSTRA